MFKDENLYDGIISQASRKYNVPVTLIKAVIGKESSFKPQAWAQDMSKGKIVAVSYGLMQLTFKTAVDLGFPNDTNRYMELMNPAVNIDLGTKYLKIIRDRYGYRTPNDIYAAYNGGPDEPKKKNPDGSYQNPGVQEHVTQFMPIYQYFLDREEYGPAARGGGPVPPSKPRRPQA